MCGKPRKINRIMIEYFETNRRRGKYLTMYIQKRTEYGAFVEDYDDTIAEDEAEFQEWSNYEI